MSAGPAAELDLAVGGMTCAACASRIERRLERLDGVVARVDLAGERVHVRMRDPVAVAELVAAIERLGFRARPVTGDARTAPPADPVPALRRRVAVALLLGVPVAHVSMALALDPGLRFAGWTVVLLVAAAPVVTWCAWPFHRGAVIAMRHGTTTMDTLVSLGVIASVAGWVLATVPGRGDPGPLYLDVALVVTLFVLAGRLFEANRAAAG